MRPGLVAHSRVQSRKNDADKRHREKCEQNRQLPARVLEQKQRDEALAKSTLSEQNKGFNLMLKMGYKAGEALGKQQSVAGEKKLLEPISIKLKTDREGLGKEHEKQQQMLEAERVRSELLKLKAESDEGRAKMYLNKKKSEFTLRKSRHNLHKCQRVCFQLDSTRGGLKEPRVKWFWPASIRRSLKREKGIVEEQGDTLRSREKVSESDKTGADMAIITTSTVHANQRMDYLEKIIDAEGISSRSNVKTIYEKRLSEFLQEDQVEQPAAEETREQIEEEREVEEENGENMETRGRLDIEQLRKEKETNEDEEMSENEELDNDDRDAEKDGEDEQDEQVILNHQLVLASN
jgi:hypothetical protein